MAKNSGYSGKRGIAPKPKIKSGGTTVSLGTKAPKHRGAPNGK